MGNIGTLLPHKLPKQGLIRYIIHPDIIMTFSILTDDEIKSLLDNLTLDELESFRENLRDALHVYSTGAHTPGQALIHQPERTVVRSGITGATTLFMPSCSPAGHGVKGMMSSHHIANGMGY